MKKVSIIIPAYNEEKRIGKTLKEYSRYFEKIRLKKKVDYELLIVINNTTDKTLELVKRESKKNERILYLDLLRGGKGYAVIEGFKDSLKRNNDLIGFVDADMATSPEEYYKLIEVLLIPNNFEGVIASRYIDGSKIYPHPTLQRKAAKLAFNFVVRSVLFLPFHDTQCGAKMFKRAAIENVLKKLTMSNWAFDVELIYAAKKNGFKIVEMPTIWIDKEYSKINFWKAGPWMVFGVMRLRLINSPFKSLLRIYDKLVKRVPR